MGVGGVLAYQFCKTGRPEQIEEPRPVRRPRNGKPEKRVTFKEPEVASDDSS